MKHGFVKVGAFTAKLSVAECEKNAKNIINGILEAQNLGVELLAFPELAITGATCYDLYFLETLLDGAKKGLKMIAKSTIDYEMLVTVGLPLKVNGSLYNVIAVINKGKVIGVLPKQNLTQTESKYFAKYLGENIYVDLFGYSVPFGSNIIFENESYNQLKVSVEFLEDVLSVSNKSVEYSKNGACVTLISSAKQELVGRIESQESLLFAHTTKLNLGLALANAGLGESTTDTVFSGVNMVMERGEILSKTKAFENGLAVSEIDVEYLNYERMKKPLGATSGETLVVKYQADNEFSLSRKIKKYSFIAEDEKTAKERSKFILEIQAEGLKKRIEHTHAKTLVLGLSGGLDSTLALLVCDLAMKKLGKSNKDIICVTMPCFGTSKRTKENSIILAKAFKTTLKKIDISKSVVRHLKDLKHTGKMDVAFENAQARERTQVLMDMANMYNGMVVGTGDLSELALGFATYNGDHMSMYAVNADIPKTLIRKMVLDYAENSKLKIKTVLMDILNTPVSPELLPPEENGEINQQTESIVGPYVLHDFFLYNMLKRGYGAEKMVNVAEYVFKGEYDRETIIGWLKVFVKRFFTQQFKRNCLPDGVKVGSVSISPRNDFSMPSDASFALWQQELDKM